MKCAALTTGQVGSKEHKDHCRLHNRWTFDCLLIELSEVSADKELFEKRWNDLVEEQERKGCTHHVSKP